MRPDMRASHPAFRGQPVWVAEQQIAWSVRGRAWVEVRRSCEASAVIGAPIDAVWRVVSDVTRVGEWSGECQGCAWVGGTDSPVPGAQFRGRNRRGSMRWTRVNQVIRAEPPHALVWRTVARFPYLDSTEWQLRLAEDGSATRVTEAFEIVRLSRAMERFLDVVMPAHRDRSTDLASDLDRLKSLVEVGSPTER
jgi:uncharacterized protein YndB with AHSA1/START domain